MRSSLIVVGLGASLVISAAACGSSTTDTPAADAGAVDAGAAGDTGAAGGCGSATPGATPACAMYSPASIATMRATKATGCFELAHIGLVAKTDSTTEPRLYVQDENGADFSAILAKCSAAAQHKCAAPVAAKIPTLLDTLANGAKLTIRGYYQYGKVTGFEELYIEDILDECAAVPRPAPIAVTLADITRDARSPGKWFRRATVDISPADPLVVYDFSPPELALAAPQCPNWEGFAMIPKSAGATAATDCSGAANPAGRTGDPREILVGRQFFHQFLFSSDCGCAAAAKQRLIAPANTVSGQMLGYLFLEQDKGATKAYQLFEPAADKTFPIK